MTSRSEPPPLTPPSPATVGSALIRVCMVNVALRHSLETAQARWSAVGSDVLANIGHELRTPLTVIQGLSEILLDDLVVSGLDVEQQRGFLAEIHHASLALGKLIETSILLTKLQAGAIEVHLQPLSVTEAVERVISQYQAEIRAKELSVSLEAPRPALAMADGVFLEVIFQALLDNAIKFNRPGGEIRWMVLSDPDAVRVSLSDTGVGIPPDRLHELFVTFSQIDSGSTRRYGGLGLGLPLVSRLLERQDGAIEACSAGHQKGATFIVRLRPASE